MTNPVLPYQAPLETAAQKPVGSGRTRTDKSLDTLAIVLAPIAVPALVLAVGRTKGGHSFLSSVTVNEVAFGVVAVAFAAIVRGLSSKNEVWRLVIFLSCVVICAESGIAFLNDSFTESGKLLEAADHCADHCDGGHIANLADQITQASPSTTQWATVLIIGVVISALVLTVIWKES